LLPWIASPPRTFGAKERFVNDTSKNAGRLQKKQLSQLLSVSVSATHYAVRWEAGVWTEPETTVMARLKGSRVLIRMPERVFFNKNTRKGFYLFEQQCLNMRSFRTIGKFLIPTGTQSTAGMGF